jgi:hypothetical protein
MLRVERPHLKAYGPQAPHVETFQDILGTWQGTIDVATCEAWEPVYDFKAASSNKLLVNASRNISIIICSFID